MPDSSIVQALCSSLIAFIYCPARVIRATLGMLCTSSTCESCKHSSSQCCGNLFAVGQHQDCKHRFQIHCWVKYFIYIGYAIYIYIYILFVTTANLWPPRSLRIYIYTYTYIYIYSFDFIIRSHFCSSDPRIKPFVLWGPLILKTLSGVALTIAAEGAG